MERLEIDEQRIQYYELGLEAQKQGNYNKAHNFYCMATEKGPIWPEALFRRGQMRYYRHNEWGAVEDVVEALDLEPALSNLFEPEGFTKEFVLKTLNSRACRQIEARNFTAANAFLEAALRLDSSYHMALLTMAELFVAQGDYYDALNWLETAVKKAPHTKEKIDGYLCFEPLKPFIRFGKIIEKDQMISNEAKKCFQSAKELLEQNEFEKAIEYFNQALELAKDWAEALYYRGFAKYRTAGNFGITSELLLQSAGVDDIAKALDYDPALIPLAENAFHLISVTNALNDRVVDTYIPEKNFEQAIQDLKLCMRIHPTHVYPFLTMAELYVAADNDEEALEWLNKAIQVDPEIKDRVDGFECFAPLREYLTYQELFVKQEKPGKSYYDLKMYVEPGAMREAFHMVSGKAENIRQAILARIKTYSGFYTLLSYGQTIEVQRFTNGILEATVDIHPFLKLIVPNELTASFAEDGQYVIRDMQGNSIPKNILSDLLFDYFAYGEETETVFLADWETKLGPLSGDIILESEEYVGDDGNLYNADTVIEDESGEEYTLEEFLNIAKAEQE